MFANHKLYPTIIKTHGTKLICSPNYWETVLQKIGYASRWLHTLYKLKIEVCLQNITSSYTPLNENIHSNLVLTPQL